MSDTLLQMASILRVCATTIRDIATSREDESQTTILSAADDADNAAGKLEQFGHEDDEDSFDRHALPSDGRARSPLRRQ